MNEAKRKNILFAVVAVVIAVVFFFAGFGTGFGVGKGAADAPDADAGAAEMDGGMQLSSDEDTDKGVSLTSVKLAREAYDDYDIMPIAETAYTVTATVSGDGLTAEQKSVTWGDAVFKDPSSEWATGKNVSDYVKTTPNGNQLTVQCLKAFGEQIIIKCSSSFNPNVSKDLKVDYQTRISGVKYSFESNIPEHSHSSSTRSTLGKIYYNETYHLSISPVFSNVYTVGFDGVMYFYQMTLSISSDVAKGLVLNGYVHSDIGQNKVTVEFASPTLEFNNEFGFALFGPGFLNDRASLAKAIKSLNNSRLIQVDVNFLLQNGTFNGDLHYNCYLAIDADSLN